MFLEALICRSVNFVFRDEFQRQRVDAIAESRGSGTVTKNVAKVRSACGTNDLRPDHAMAEILFQYQVFFGIGIKETGPSRAGIEFGTGFKKTVSTGNAFVMPLAIKLVIFA